MPQKQRHELRRFFIPPGALIGNLLWAAIVFVALRCHFYDFISAVVLFKVLNELTMSRTGQRPLAALTPAGIADAGSHLQVD